MAEEKVYGGKDLGVNFETRMKVLEENIWTTAAIPLSLYACIHQQAVVDRIGRRPHLRHIYVNRYWPTRTLCMVYCSCIGLPLAHALVI